MLSNTKFLRIGFLSAILVAQFFILIAAGGFGTSGLGIGSLGVGEALAQAPANNAPSNTFGNATATATPNPEGVYVGHGVESSIRTLLCAPSNVSSATTSNTSAPGLLNTNGTATVTNNPAANDLANCINKGYRFALAFGAVAAVFFIVIAGYMYMVGGEHGKSEAKEILISVLAGFLIMLASFVLLKQINPTLTQFRSIQPPALQGNYSLPNCKDVGLGQDCILPNGTKGVGDGKGGGVSKGSCKAVTNPASGCDADKLKNVCSWDAQKASGTCSAESAGGMDPGIGGQADKCYLDGPDSPGVPMSIGYFQISLFGSYAPEFNAECNNVIVEDKSGCYETKTLPNSGLSYCAKRKCSLPKGRAAYDACVKAITSSADRQYKQACNLYKQAGNSFKPWSAAHECGYYP